MNMESTLSVATTATQMFSSRESMFITTRPRVRYVKIINFQLIYLKTSEKEIADQ